VERLRVTAGASYGGKNRWCPRPARAGRRMLTKTDKAAGQGPVWN
jgi:hypothetical protein